MFQVVHDPAAGLIRITVRGFWTVDAVPRFAAAIGATALEARALRDDSDVIIDSLEFPVQSSEVAEMMTAVMRGGIAHTRGRVAIVVASHLNKLQAERTLAHPRIGIFLDMHSAQRWLAEAH